MNKHQKRIIKLAKKIMKNCRKDTDLSKFRLARYYVRCILEHREKQFLDWYQK